MKKNTLKFIRVVLAVLIFSPIFLFFCDFANLFPNSFSTLLGIQFVPAVLTGSVLILIFLTALTLLFGRIYCSVICPLGIFQDIIAWFTKKRKKKNKKKRGYKYARPLTILRYSILCICIGFLIFGIATPLVFLDPYSSFGRIAVNIFRPFAMEVNNLVNWVALKLHIYNFYYVSIYTVTGWSLAIAIATLLIVGIMALLRGRLYCNTICPVGSLLGLLSRFSLFRIVLDSQCTGCGLCEHICKSQCIDTKEKFIDYSRCVVCFNCLKQCKSGHASYRFAYNRSSQAAVTKEKNPPVITTRTNEIGMTRRSFLVTSTTIAATLPIFPVCAKPGEEDQSNAPQSPSKHHSHNKSHANWPPITPPGSISLDHFKEHCTACHLCITHCPQQILKPAGFNYGINYAFKPHLVFYEMAFCNYECTVCSEICPTGAIRKLSKGEKKLTQIGVAQLRRGRCIVITDQTSCGACSEHCPTQAVRMEPYMNGLTAPYVYSELCIGCGGCESICPVRPIKAINVLANNVHQMAEKHPEDNMEINHKNLDFGF